MSKTRYSTAFYAEQSTGSGASAEVIVPIVLDAVRPTSVVDVGCGVGTWLSVFGRHGVSDLLGVDGDYVRPDQLQISRDDFRPMDLTRPTSVGRTFDLVVSLEVAEHLPADRADQFVELLTSLGPVVCFSAAIPGQGGTGHINEQWPTYWATIFASYGYEQLDGIRGEVWDDSRVAVEYAQNTMLYAAADRFEEIRGRLAGRADLGGRPMVHPRLYEAKMLTPDMRAYSPRALLSTIGASSSTIAASAGALPGSCARTFRQRREARSR